MEVKGNYKAIKSYVLLKKTSNWSDGDASISFSIAVEMTSVMPLLHKKLLCKKYKQQTTGNNRIGHCNAVDWT